MSALELKGLFTRGRAVAASLALGTAIMFTPMSAVSAQTTVGDGLVNVAVGDVTILENVDIGVAAQVAANVCGVKVGPVAVLGRAVDRTNQPRTVCEAADGSDVTITQN